jgi:PAS domain-containing protein
MNSKIENAFEKQNLNVSLELFGGSTELLQKVLDTIPQSVFWKDRDSVYLGCNHLFAELAGLKSSTEIVGLTDFDLPWSKENFIAIAINA